jgi:hypothetical protein
MSFSGTEVCVFYLEEGSSRFFRNRTTFIPHYTVSNAKMPQFSNALQHKKLNLLYSLYFWYSTISTWSWILLHSLAVKLQDINICRSGAVFGGRSFEIWHCSEISLKFISYNSREHGHSPFPSRGSTEDNPLFIFQTLQWRNCPYPAHRNSASYWQNIKLQFSSLSQTDQRKPIT